MMMPSANLPSSQVVDSVGVSDNEWSVNYAGRVVYIIGQDAEVFRSTRALRYLTAPSVVRACGMCSRRFVALVRDVKRPRRGLTCSRACAARMSAARRHALVPQTGSNNPNWRGGRSSRPYESYVRHFKAAHPQKTRAHQLVARAVRSGHLHRPLTCSACAASCRAQAHHEDYAQPLVVVWLCKSCHVQADRRRVQIEGAGHGA